MYMYYKSDCFNGSLVQPTVAHKYITYVREYVYSTMHLAMKKEPNVHMS